MIYYTGIHTVIPPANYHPPQAEKRGTKTILWRNICRTTLNIQRSQTVE